MMTAYFVFVRDSTEDAAELAAYGKAAVPTFAPFPQAKILTLYGKQEAIEGPAPEGIAIIEFPSLEEAKAWYNSDAYQEAVQHRFRGATYRVTLVEST